MNAVQVRIKVNKKISSNSWPRACESQGNRRPFGSDSFSIELANRLGRKSEKISYSACDSIRRQFTSSSQIKIYFPNLYIHNIEVSL